jgi:hypothetical protein
MQKTRRLAQAMARNMAHPGSDSYTLVGCEIVLYKAGPTPTPDSVLSEFTPCDFSGYADETITFSGPINESDGSATMIGSMTVYNLSDTITTNTVLGALLLFGNDSLGLAAADQFSAPVVLAHIGDGFGYVPALNSGGITDNDEGIVVS